MAQKHGLKIHVDGARIFNAAIALGVEAKQLLTEADSVSFCLSKGLCAPVGSLVCGSKDFIDGARRNRKLLGGGMRQAGVLAAAGIVALTEMVDRLVEDHANARKLAEGLAGMAELRIDPLGVRTNILYFELDIPSLDAPAFTRRLAGEGVRMLPTGPRQIRAVAHHPLTSADMDAALDAFRRVLAG